MSYEVGLQERAGRPPRAAQRRGVPLHGRRPAIHRGRRRGQPRPAAQRRRRARPGASSSTARSRSRRNFLLTAGRQLQRHRDRGRHAGRRHLRAVHGDRSDVVHRRHHPRAGRRQPVPQRARVDRRPDRALGHAGRAATARSSSSPTGPTRARPTSSSTNREEFVTDGQIEGGLEIGYAALDGSWEVAAFGRNITDEDNVKGGIDFNNNTAFVNEPRTFGISARFRY